MDNRLFVDAILWMAGDAAHWRDFPGVFAKWTAVHARFRRWPNNGVWERLFNALADTPGQHGDCPQAQALLSGLKSVGHVIADAAYDADPLSAFITDQLGATAQIKANPSRAFNPTIDWKLDKERHQVECFFNKLKRFRTIAPRREKTVTAFIGLVHLAGAMIWLR